MKKIVSLLPLAAFIFFVLNAAPSPAGVAICGPQGEVLYKRHCSACHRDAAKLKAVKNVGEIIRNPPDVMPNFDKNKISVTSPFGKGLMGKSQGDIVSIRVPAGELKYKILEIRR